MAPCLLLLVASFVLLASGTGSESKHVVDLSGLLPPVARCYPPKEPWKLKLVHKNGPCTPFRNGRRTPPPSNSEILEQDRVRVDLLHRRTSVQSDLSGSEAVQLPTQLGGSVGVANYVVTVGIGTPKRDFTVIMDTGSDVSWIQCAPCASCYQQKDALFDPTQSSTYGTYSCSSQECGELSDRERSCSDQQVCRYEVEYGDNSRTAGNFGSDALTLSSDVVLPDFMFGCGDHYAGKFGEADGLIGLGRRSVSLVSQLSPKYGSVFSYCLPSSSSFSGYLTIGSGGPSPANAQYTRMLSSNLYSSFYFVNLASIQVKGQLLPVNSAAGTIMDSGTVISRLPPAAYEALREAFKQQMGQYPATANSSWLLDTCYDLTGYQSGAALPTVALVFEDGVTLDLEAGGILYPVKGMSEVCLAFAPTSDANDVAIIGNLQQRRYEVIYDVEHSEIGFAPRSCS